MLEDYNFHRSFGLIRLFVLVCNYSLSCACMRCQVKSRSDMDLQEAMQVHAANKPMFGKKANRTETEIIDDDDSNGDDDEPQKQPKLRRGKPDKTTSKPGKAGKGSKAKIKKVSVWDTPWATKEETKKKWSLRPSVWEIGRTVLDR